MPFLVSILEFIGMQLLKAVLTAQAVKDVTLGFLKYIATHTKNTFDDQIYKRVKFYMTEDRSERFDGSAPPPVQDSSKEDDAPIEDDKPKTS